METARTNWVIRNYDPFSTTAVPIDEFDVTFVNEGADTCSLRPIFDLENEAFGLDQGTSARVPYRLLDRTGDYDVTPRTGTTVRNPTNPLVVIAPHGQQLARFRLAVGTDNIATDGLFVQHARINAEDDSGTILASKQLTLGLDVQPAALIGLSGAFRLADGRAVVDLGELHEGVAPVVLNLYVQSTRAYTVTVDSQNLGNLQLANTRWTIPYQVVLGDRTLPRGARAEYNSTLGTALARKSVPLNFAIGNVADRRAGNYSDLITISVAVQ
ncbi:MAG: hypothetical protein ABIS14_08840 [Sphingomonas sp.]